MFNESDLLSLVPTSNIRIISISIIININISFLCSSGNGCTKDSKNVIPMRVSVEMNRPERTGPRILLAKTQ